VIAVVNGLDYYLIHPVYNLSEDLKKKLDSIVAAIEATGERVHYPIRNVDQDDDIGDRICSDHRAAMKKIKKGMKMWYDPVSRGSVFDVGMGFMARKPLEILNPESIENITSPYERFIVDYASQGTSGLAFDNHISQKHREMAEKRKLLEDMTVPIKFVWRQGDWESLLTFGMIFFAEKEFLLLNRHEVEAQANAKDRKCYEKVLIKLDDKYQGKK
jgi:hypothetical protein